MKNLGGLGGTCTIVNDLNNRGQVVGASNIEGDQVQIAFLWENAKLQQLRGSLGGSTGAFAINDAGEAVGFGCLGGVACPSFHATLWKNVGSITDLGVVDNDQCSFAAVINASGQVAGSSISSCTAKEPNFRAFLWEGGSIFDLNTLIPQDSTLYLTDIFAISDLGEMAGQGVDPSGNQHAFLLIPCDENHPGIEGCDYSLVDSTATAEVRPVRAAQPSAATSENKVSPAKMMARIRSARAGRNRRLGNVPLQ